MIYFKYQHASVRVQCHVPAYIYRRLHHDTYTCTGVTMPPKCHLMSPMTLKVLNSTLSEIYRGATNDTKIRNATPKYEVSLDPEKTGWCHSLMTPQQQLDITKKINELCRQ